MSSYDNPSNWDAAVGAAALPRGDVATVVRRRAGRNDDGYWLAYGTKPDGTWWGLRAWCDYTGWG